MKNLINNNLVNSRAIKVNDVYIGTRAQMSINGVSVSAVDDPDGNEIDLIIGDPGTPLPTTVNQSSILLHMADPLVDGGTATADSWRVRPINSMLVDDIGITLSNDPTINALAQIEIPQGNYELDIWQEFYSTGPTNCRLFNITDSVAVPTMAFQSQWINPNQRSTLMAKGRINIASTKNFRLEYYVGSTVPLVGLGMSADNGSGSNQIYAMITIKKLGV